MLSVIANLNSLTGEANRKSFEKITSISREYKVFDELIKSNFKIEYIQTQILLSDKKDDAEEIKIFSDFESPDFQDDIFQEFDKLGIAPHLFNFGIFIDHFGVSRKAGVIKAKDKWITNGKFTSKPLAEKNFGILVEPGFINFLVHIALEQERDEWIGAMRQERYTYFERLMQYVESDHAKKLYSIANIPIPGKEDKLIDAQIKEFLKRLLQFMPLQSSQYVKSQPQAKR